MGDVAERHELHRMAVDDRRGHLRDVAASGAWSNLDRRVTRDIDRIVFVEGVRPAFCVDLR
jgi:hypothetical protein